MNCDITDEETLRRLYHDEGLTMQEIADRFDTTFDRVRYYKRKYDIEGRPKGVSPEAYSLDEQTLRTWYHADNMTISEIADRVDCSNTYIQNRMDEWGIERQRRGPQKRPPSFHTTADGYERVVASNGRGRNPDAIKFHRLIAVAFGADMEKVFSNGDYHVHHKNGIPWDNRPENLAVVSKSTHHRIHVGDIPRDGEGNFTTTDP